MKLLIPILIFVSSLVFGQSFPHLLISPERLEDIQAAVTVPGSSHAEMLQSLQADVDAESADVIDGGTRSLPGRNYARGFLAKKAAMVYAVTEDADYAQIAYDALEAMYTDPLGGNVVPDGAGGKGLERATVGKAYAVAYDLAYNGWTEAQRAFVREKLLSSLDHWQGAGFSFDNNINPYASNWVAVCYGSNLLQLLVLGEQTNPDRVEHYDRLVTRLVTHMSHYGNKGWTQEGNYYMTYAQQFLIPAIHAMRRKGDTRLNGRLAEKGMYLIPMYGGMFDAQQRSTQWGVGGSTFGQQGWTSLIFSIVPEEMQGAYRWFYDRHRGILNDAPLSDRYDPNHAGTVYGMMFYPEAVDPVDPSTLLPSGLFDDKGGYWFRSGWRDADDVIVSLSTDTRTHGNAWDEADALQVSFLGFGDKFAGGPGTSRDARFFSQVTVDGQARASQSGTGTAEFFEANADGGYAIAGGGSKFGGLGISFSRRHLKVSYPDEDDIAVISTFDVLNSVQLREYAWQLNSQNLPLFTGEEDGVPTFTLRGENGGYLKGWMIYPADGSFFEGNRVSYSFEANDAEIWVVMAMGRGAAPSARIEGEGLDAEWILGQRRLRWNDNIRRIELLEADAPVSGFNMSPLSGLAPLTVSFEPGLTSGNPQWDFGDGNSSADPAPSHTFQTGGVFPVTLTQDDGAGGTLRSTHYVTVLNNAPLAVIDTNSDKGDPPLTVHFDASTSSDPDGHALSFTWDFGDESPPATGPQVSHTYTTQGTYFASVTVEDGHGGVGGAVRRIEVGNQAPTAVFTHSSTFGIPPVTVDFDASGSTDPEGDSLTFSWDFGDGNTGSGVSPSHTYTGFGEFDVLLTVDDGEGNLVSVRQTLRIQNQPPVPAFTFSPATGSAPLSVSFNASGSVDPEGQALSYTWDFGDGATGAGVSPSHTFTEPMNTQVQLTVTDAQGASSSLFKPISILDAEGRRAPEFSAEAGEELLPGVFFQLYNASVWRRNMGNINTLSPLSEGVLPMLDIRYRQQADQFAFRFTGYFKVPESGAYTFRAQVRDNLHLTLGGLEVLNTGTGKQFSGPVTVENTVGLSAGYHAFEARFHASDSNAPDWYPLLQLSWAGPGFAMRSVLPEDLFWAPGRPVIDFLVSPDPGQLILPETVNFLPEDPVGTRSFFQPASGEPLTLNFEGGPSSAPDGEIVRHIWDFGNGAVGAGRTVSQSYSAGTYVVTLTVETEGGATFTTGQTIRVLDPPEQLDFGRDFGKRVSANGQFLPNTGPENLFDGSTDTRWLVNESEGFIEVHFEQSGRRYGYVADEYTLTNPPAWNDRDPKDIVFSGTLDGVNWEVIDVRNDLDWEGQTRYTRSFPVSNTTAYSGYRWDIVPQAESPQGWFVELYRIQLFGNAPGIQPVTRAPLAAFSAPGEAEISQPVVFHAGETVSPDGYPLMYFWDFGDGQTAVTTGPSVTHHYFDAGDRQVRLRVRDPFGNLSTAPVWTLSVGENTNANPVAAFSISQEGDLFTFDATDTVDPDGDPVTFRWDFGDGISSVGAVTSHVFHPGTYSVTLTAEDNRGGRDVLSRFVDARPTVNPEVISLNFTTGSPTLLLENYEYAGAVPVRYWNNVTRDGATLSGFIDNNGEAAPLTVTQQSNRAYRNNTTPVDSGLARMLATSWTRNGSSATYTLDDIPYLTYDLYVYFAGSRVSPPQTQRITINGESLFIRDETGGWDGNLAESTATSAAAAVDGPAYVVFRNLSGPFQSIHFGGMNDPGPAGIQIVNTAEDDPFQAWMDTYFPSEDDETAVVDQGGIPMRIRDIWIAGLTPGTEERFEITGWNEAGLPMFDAREGREYRIRWTDDLTNALEAWYTLHEFGEEPPASAPWAERVFYRIEVRVSE
ncbi:MAG: PKD domain-containing protein [Verrucomicrobia bacterium]|nr:PKD domain-containing protein [Verrucomicrobiota bacterium]MCH8528687.1 PKD domain-containing protein [Kiritimatiellia bacterium]